MAYQTSANYSDNLIAKCYLSVNHEFLVCEVWISVSRTPTAACILPKYYPHSGRSGPDWPADRTHGADATVRHPHPQHRRF